MQVLFAASVHVAVAFEPTVRQVTLRLKSDKDGTLGLAQTTPAIVRKEKKIRMEGISVSEYSQSAVNEIVSSGLMGCIWAEP